MANNDYITTDCKLTVSKNTAKLDEEIFLYKNDRNIKLLIEIVDNKYRYKSDDLSNLLVKYKASYAQVKWYKNAEVKKEFPIQATDDGKVVFVIEGQLIDEDTELGDYDLQLRLLNESQESIRSLPIIKGAVHILKPLFEEGDIATVNSAVADVSMLSLDGDAIDTYNSDGTYNQTNWGNGDVISSAKLNKLEKVAKDNVDKVNKMPAKSIVEGGKIYLAKEDGTKLDSGTELPAGGTGTSYDDTEIKTDINTIKTDLGTETLTTTAKDVKGAINEVAAQYKDIANKIENGNIGNNVEPQLMDMPRIYFSEGTLPTSKTATVMKFDYYSKTNEYHGYVDIKCQGNSSMSYPKKNFTIKPYQDKTKTKKLKIDFKGWGKQSKFVLKANWIDISHARNVVSARLWGDIIKTRVDYTTALPELLRTSPNQGAIDGFPVLVYSNGVYQGRYTLNIPKDKWMSNMDDALDTHCILCGENYASGCFRALPVINGTDWTDELHDVVPATIKTSWTNAIKFVMNSTDAEFKANLSNYFDINSLIDYYLYGLVATNLDGFGKNQLFFCYDGIHWIASVYDMDSTWGLYWNGSRILPTNYARNQYEDYVNKTSNLLYNRLEQLFMTQLKARYAELRKDVLSASHIIQKFEEFNDVCPKDIVQEDYASTTGEGKFTGMPSLTTNNIQQLRNNIVGRLTYVDGYINALQEATPCTAITLNNTALTFTTDAAQTLTATVTPTDTTDKVVWSVSPTGFVTVNNGVVTPVNNGACVITATCGTQRATCNVTVNLPVQAVTALNLDKDSITLGNSADADTSNVNLLEGVNHTIDTTNNNIVFDSITLDSGIYIFKNINGGSFTWLGADYDGSKHEIGNTSEDFLFKFNNSTIAQFHAFPNNKATNTADKLGLYKIATTLTNPIKFTLAGHGYYSNGNFVEDDNNVYSTAVNLDASKKYVLMNEGANQVNDGNCAWKIDNGSGGKNVTKVLVNFPIKVFENVTSLSISINTVNNALADITLYEAASATTKFEDTLTATLTPPNATNKNVTWTADNENVQLVANGLKCTVKAKAVGDSIVTCTSQDTTNGTITDTCNVTVSAVPEQPATLYTLPQEKVFNGTSDFVDTGVQLFKTDQDFTITMDVTPDTQTEGSASLVHCMKEQSPYRGLNIQRDGVSAFALNPGNNQKSMAGLIPLGQRTKLVIVKNGTTMKVYNSNNIKGESPYTFTAIDQTLLLGAYQDVNGNKGRFFKGTVHEFSIIDAVYSNEQINAYLGVNIATD